MDSRKIKLEEAIDASIKAKEEYIKLYKQKGLALFYKAQEKLDVDAHISKEAFYFANRHQMWEKINEPCRSTNSQNETWIGVRPFFDLVLEPRFAYYPVRQCSRIINRCREVGNLEIEIEALRLHQKFSELYLIIEHGYTAAVLKRKHFS